MTAYNKPLPSIDDKSRPFWEGTKRHELLLLKCPDCGYIRSPMGFGIAENCPRCLSMKPAQWVKASGKGKVKTWTVVYRPFHPGFLDEVPYAVVMIELEEGPRVLSNMVGCKPEEIKAGMPVEVVFEDVTPEVTLPKFRLVGRG